MFRHNVPMNSDFPLSFCCFNVNFMARYITRHEPLTTALLKNQVTLCAVVPSSSVSSSPKENIIIWNNKNFTEVRVTEIPNKQQRSLEFSRSEEKNRLSYLEL